MSKVSIDVAEKLRPFIGQQVKCKSCGDGTLMTFAEIEGRYGWVCSKEPDQHILKVAGWKARESRPS